MTTEQKGVSPATAGGASAPDFNAIRDAVVDSFRAVPLWQFRQGLVAAGLIPADTEIQAAERKPVHGGPGIRAEWDEDVDAMRVDGIGWDLSFGCTVSFAYDPAKDEYYACVSTSDADQRAGITSRRTTKEQLASLGQQLLNVFGEPDPRDAEIARLRAELDKMSSGWAARQKLVQERDQALAEIDELEIQRDDALRHNGQLASERNEAREESRRADAEVTRLRKLHDAELNRAGEQAQSTLAHLTAVGNGLRDRLDKALEENGRLRAELDLAAKQLARVGLQVATIQAIASDIGKELQGVSVERAVPRGWVSGDPEPAIGTTVSTGKFTYTRGDDGHWRRDDGRAEAYTWKHLTYYTPVVEVVSTDGG